MKRQIIEIDEEKCNGCGLCAKACHEGAIEIINGKAKLTRDDYCDGLGDCLPNCPKQAIRFVVREAAAYDEKAVKRNQRRHLFKRKGKTHSPQSAMSCPGSSPVSIQRTANNTVKTETADTESALTNWPVQIKLAPITAPYFADCSLLIAANCTAYAYADIHKDFIKNRICLIGCTKLDDIDYTQKLTQIIENNTIRDITVLKMQVPCCSKMQLCVEKSIKNSHKNLPVKTYTVSIRGDLL